MNGILGQNGVFLHKPSSIYDDDPATRYHFPAQYKRSADTFLGNWILYYEPGPRARYYKAVAKVADIVDDPTPRDKRHFYARIEPGTYLDFLRPVPFRRKDGTYRNSLIEAANAGRKSHLSRLSVRPIPAHDLARIVDEGLEFCRTEPEALSRDAVSDPISNEPVHYRREFGEPSQAFQVSALVERGDFSTDARQTVDRLLKTSVRDRAFRAGVLKAYDSRCALTRLRFVNGGGRAEVQAAHIRPVAHGGSDSLRNGIAMSGTVHWMFDRGLISLGDDMEVLVSRHVNNTDEVARLIPQSRAMVPQEERLRPHPGALAWHRENVFKT